MTRREQVLRNALAQLIEIDAQEVSVNKSFAELGVDSLLGLRLAREIQDQVKAEIELEWLFEHPTIRQLSQYLDERFGSLDVELHPSK